ncbi:hypothetical protein E3N88_34564 [Mikania micrantha]|uniref:Integrase catalytic domain-containing protein n=1 Tax=Mikania micrantha TaxID=192012 RepID=A0A5N6LYI1_9ASTR|nr:hypothetical protein E3N88_34564 [Mikania micrantha]
MVVVNRLTKCEHFIGLSTVFNSSNIADAFSNEIVQLHGIPANIVTDGDHRFMTQFWNELHRLHGTTLSFTIAYHPQSNGESEALNKCVELFLRCYTADQPNDLMCFIPWAEYCSPAQAELVRKPVAEVKGPPAKLSDYAWSATSANG